MGCLMITHCNQMRDCAQAAMVYTIASGRVKWRAILTSGGRSPWHVALTGSAVPQTSTIIR